jgi:SAM-dependent methyltransferase
MNQSSWDRRYAGADHPGCSAPAQALTSRLATLPPGHAIDLACGLGRHARFLADSGCSVEAVDYSPVAIEVAKAAHEGGQIDYTVADVRTWKPVQPADLVVISYLHMPIDELVEVITTAGTWLRPDGHLLYLGHSLENSMFGVGGPADRAVLPDLADLARAARGLRVLELAHLVNRRGAQRSIDVLLHAVPWGVHPHRAFAG